MSNTIEASELAQLTINNHAEMLKGRSDLIGETSEVKRQIAHVAAHADRCIRCGTPTYALMGAKDLCDDCLHTFMEDDQSAAPGVLWYAQLLQVIKDRARKVNK